NSFRLNFYITYILMYNQIYGLTKGQTSPRREAGFKPKSTPQGSIEPSLNVMEKALAAGATFVAQSFTSDLKELTQII
ncbi:thiamine pyrophosphate-dependent enzyme, partial [Bacillus cereus]|uniref:thiamine pyrophosphate-dependent enzyme n=1 Tax=Bacillus cereus TaxID=1396 RepID=UPI002113612F|nr:thiamine pyrophosphate-dependent enzyme [Bacillus cereus]